jgi:hypothetical protein
VPRQVNECNRLLTSIVAWSIIARDNRDGEIRSFERQTAD